MTRVDCTIRLKNQQTETDHLCERLDEFGRDAGLSAKSLRAINLAIEELFTNVVSYGFTDGKEHTIIISLIQEGGTVTIRMEDDGAPFDPEKAAPPDLECAVEESVVGGLGIHLAKHLMDGFRYERRGDKNIVTMTKIVSDS